MSKQPQQPRMRRPRSASKPNKGTPPTKPKVPTLESMLADIRKAYGMQLNTFVVQFLDNHSDDDIEAFLPADIAEADAWIDGLVDAFTDNDDPDTDDMMDAASALFMMAFLEKLYEACGIASEDDEVDESDDEDDSEE